MDPYDLAKVWNLGFLHAGSGIRIPDFELGSQRKVNRPSTQLQATRSVPESICAPVLRSSCGPAYISAGPAWPSSREKGYRRVTTKIRRPTLHKIYQDGTGVAPNVNQPVGSFRRPRVGLWPQQRRETHRARRYNDIALTAHSWSPECLALC